MANVFFGTAIDGIGMNKIRSKYKRIEKALQARKHKLLNPAEIYLKSFSNAMRSNAHSLSTTVVETDLHLLRQADVLLLDVSLPSHTYVGCICEMVYAKEWGIPVVSYIGRNHISKRPFFVYHSSAVYKRLNDALDHIGISISRHLPSKSL